MGQLKRLFSHQNAKAGSYYLAGSIFDKAFVFLTIPIMTRIMSSADYGIVNTYLSWVSILSIILGLSLGNSIRNAYADHPGDLEGYVSSIFFLSLLNFMGMALVILLVSAWFVPSLDFVLVILCLVQSFMTFIMNAVQIKYMMSVQYKKRTLLQILPNVFIIAVAVIWIMAVTDRKYMGRILPHAAVTSIIGLAYIAVAFIRGKKLVDFGYWRYGLMISLPLILHGLSNNILAVSDRTMITYFRGASETGVYSLVYSMSMISAVVMSSLESVWIPWFTKKMQMNDIEIVNRNVKLYIEIVVVVMLGILLIGPDVLVFAAPQEYWGGKHLIPPILMASFFIFLYSISVDLEYYYKATKKIASNTVFAASMNLILNFLLVPAYGAMAAAFTTVAAYILLFMLHYRTARKLDNRVFPWQIYSVPIIIIVLSSIAAYILLEFRFVRWTLLVIGLAAYAYIGWKHKRYANLMR